MTKPGGDALEVVQVAQQVLWGLTLIAAFVVLRGYGAVGLAAAYVIAFAVSLAVQWVMILNAKSAIVKGPDIEVEVEEGF